MREYHVSLEDEKGKIYQDFCSWSRSCTCKMLRAAMTSIHDGLTNLELERKVGFRPYRRKAPRKPT